MKPIRVMHLTFDMGIGGTEQVIKNLINGSNAQQVAHHLCCIESPLGPWGSALREEGIPTFSFSRPPKLDWALIKEIRSLIREYKIDIVQGHQYTPWIYGFFAAFSTPAKVIFTEHGRFYPDITSFKRRVINRILFPFVARTTVISNATKAAIVKNEAIKTSSIDVIYNGIEPVPSCSKEELDGLRNTLGFEEDTLIFGTIARFDPIKNQTMMLRAFAKARAKNNNIKLVLVGDGPERNTLEALVDELEIRSDVRFTGYQPQPYRYVQLFDVFLLSSLSEGTSMTLLEAMSAGKPCIVTDAGGNPELIEHEYNGLVTENANEAQFANAIGELANRNLSSMQTAAFETFAKRFTVEAMIQAYLKLYRNILKLD